MLFVVRKLSLERLKMRETAQKERNRQIDRHTLKEKVLQLAPHLINPIDVDAKQSLSHVVQVGAAELRTGNYRNLYHSHFGFSLSSFQ
uniref:Uncharacterized protein n=1 Tax=Poecilia reticulata TaxID=8081 RepID=A0A3P9NNV1_POERE